MIRLGLIGDNIRRSKSPLLHRLAGRLCGLDVAYEPLIPADLGVDFETAFEQCREAGFRGINITYPYKERAFERLAVSDPAVGALGACNTVVFGEGRPAGYNTDYTGFKAAFVDGFRGRCPGVVAIAGAGGVGKAIGFALADLGATEIRIFDLEMQKAEALADAVEASAPAIRVVAANGIEQAVEGVDGLVNCTPVGMTGLSGSAIPAALIGGQAWAFDAVYTPVETVFLGDARRAGLTVMSGYELFFHQGVDAFRIFTGRAVDPHALRVALRDPEAAMRRTA